MVASGQMVTLDSPGSDIMKWSTPTLQLAKLKFFFSSSPLRANIFGVWIKGYVKEHKASPKIGRFIPVMILSSGVSVICTTCQICTAVHLHRPPSDIMTSIHCIHTFIFM